MKDNRAEELEESGKEGRKVGRGRYDSKEVGKLQKGGGREKDRREKKRRHEWGRQVCRKEKKDKEGILAATLWFPLPRTI
jgi:hypothetical protein